MSSSKTFALGGSDPSSYPFQMPLTVNGEIIEDDVVGQEFASIKAQYEGMGKVSCCERDDEFRGYARDNIIARVLLTQEAKRNVPEPKPEEIDAAFDQLLKEHGGEEQFYSNMGLPPGQTDFVRESIKINLQVDHLIDRTCGPRPDPSDEELNAFYHEHQSEYMTVEEVRASHIFKSVRQVEDREDLFRECREQRMRILAGAEFEAVAREFSDKPAEEIDLGFFKRGELMDEFELVAFSMNVGEVSPVFGTQWGFHLAKVTDRKPRTLRPFPEVSDKVAARFIEQKRNEGVERLVGDLKKKAEITESESEATA